MRNGERLAGIENRKERFLLSESSSSEIFEEQIVPYLFAGKVRSQRPKAIFVGGQPGSGKTPLLRYITEHEMELDNNFVEINGDDFRAFHPEYTRLLDKDDQSAAFFTDLDSARWIEKSIAHAATIGCSVGIEGTLRQKEVVSKTSELFRANGYDISLNVLLAHSLSSRLGIFERYLEQVKDSGSGRFTLREAHDASYNALPSTVEHLMRDSVVNEVNLFARGGVKIGQWELNEDEATSVRDQILQMIIDNRLEMPANEISHIQNVLPRIKNELLVLEKVEMLKEIEVLEKDFLKFVSKDA